MKISILAPNEEIEKHALATIEKGVRNQLPAFEWEVVHTKIEFLSDLNSFKISAFPLELSEAPGVGLFWPKPSRILKNAELKAKIWEEIQEHVLSVFQAEPAVQVPEINLTSKELESLLKGISQSSVPFTLKTKEGLRVGVNTFGLAGIDILLTTGDISSMLAASWVFGSSGIQVPKDYRAGRDNTS